MGVDHHDGRKQWENRDYLSRRILLNLTFSHLILILSVLFSSTYSISEAVIPATVACSTRKATSLSLQPQSIASFFIRGVENSKWIRYSDSKIPSSSSSPQLRSAVAQWDLALPPHQKTTSTLPLSPKLEAERHKQLLSIISPQSTRARLNPRIPESEPGRRTRTRSSFRQATRSHKSLLLLPREALPVRQLIARKLKRRLRRRATMISSSTPKTKARRVMQRRIVMS